MDYKHGKGEMEYYADGRIVRGLWINGKKQGEFEVTFKDRASQKVLYKDNKIVEELDAKDLIKNNFHNICWQSLFYIYWNL